MPAGKGKAGIDHLREAVSRRVDGESLRRVARDVGMSPSGLQKFLEGAQPYTKTQRKLERWYVREAAATYGAGMSSDEAEAALRLLLSGLRSDVGIDTRRRMLELLGEAHGDDPPRWLTALDEES